MEIRSSGRQQRLEARSRRLVILVAASNLAMYGSLGLGLLGAESPVLGFAIASAFLIVIPGSLLRLVLVPSEVDLLDRTLYTVGLGVALLMGMLAFINATYPLIGVARPISPLPIAITETVVTTGLLLIAAWRIRMAKGDPHEMADIARNWRFGRELSPTLLLTLLPVLSIIGSYQAAHGDITLLMILFPLLCAVPVLSILTKFIPETCYSIAIFSTSLSLLLQNALVSTHLWGWDIQYEYYLGNLVLRSGAWNPTLPNPTNGMLSVVVLAPSLSVTSGLELAWIFKVAYPILFALVPVIVFSAARKLMNARLALLSALFVAYLFIFYTEMLQLARQEVAELFLALIFLALADPRLKPLPKTTLLIAFGASLVVSHYGTSYLFLLTVVAAWFLLKIWPRKGSKLISERTGLGEQQSETNIDARHGPRAGVRANQLQLGFVLTLASLSIAWYLYVSGSSAFIAVTQIGRQITGSIVTDLLSSQTTQGLSIIVGQTPSPLHNVTKLFHLATQAFVLVGLSVVLLHKRHYTIPRDLLGLSMSNVTLWIGAVTIPYFASAINTTRLYQLTLIALAPFCVVGGIFSFEVIIRTFAHSGPGSRNFDSLKPMAVFLAVFLLLNCGWAYQALNDSPTSLSMNPQLDFPRYNDREFAAANWLASSMHHTEILADENRYELLLGSGVPFSYLYEDTSSTPDGRCLFVGAYNLRAEVLLARLSNRTPLQTIYVPLNTVVGVRNLVYENGGARIYC